MKAPKKKGLLLTILDSLRGNPPAVNTPQTTPSTQAFNISKTRRNQIMTTGMDVTEKQLPQRAVSAAGLDNILQGTFVSLGSKKLENDGILTMFPDLKKAARLVISSTYAPTDLSRKTLPFALPDDFVGLSADEKADLEGYATEFFEKRLNLKTAAPKWSYKAAFSVGAVLLVVIPQEVMGTLIRRDVEDGLGTESLTDTIDRVARFSLYGFNSDPRISMSASVAPGIGMESMLDESYAEINPDHLVNTFSKEAFRNIAKEFIGTESLTLTDNPAVLNVGDTFRANMTARRQKKAKARLKEQNIVVIPNQPDNPRVTGNPIDMEFPAESVALLFPPGDPEDPCAALIAIDDRGYPIDVFAASDKPGGYNTSTTPMNNNVFDEAWQAFGVAREGGATAEKRNLLYNLYQSVVSKYLLEKARVAGFESVDIGSSDAVFRCLFSRFLSAKKTHILLLPKEYFTYFTYENDRNGLGVSRLEGIKMFLGMRQAILVSRLLASIRAATDMRNITVTLDPSAMQDSETIYKRIVSNYIQKNLLNFNTVDPNALQTQMTQRGMTIKGMNIPGFTQFDIQNDPQQRNSTFDFDPNIMDYLDRQVNSGMRVPASAMQALDENEFARALTTTNLFFSMDISIDQDICTRYISDHCRKYGRNSEEFRAGIAARLPNVSKANSSSGKDGASTDSEADEVEAGTIDSAEARQAKVTVDQVIDALTLSLPRVNLAPTKSQFDILDSMTNSVTNLINSVLPDGIAGQDTDMQNAVATVKSFLIRQNLQSIMARAGMDDYQLPGEDFNPMAAGIGEFTQALKNLGVKLKSAQQLTEPRAATPMDDGTGGTLPPDGGDGGAPTDVPGYL